jgi:hypothetical protein
MRQTKLERSTFVGETLISICMKPFNVSFRVLKLRMDYVKFKIKRDYSI